MDNDPRHRAVAWFLMAALLLGGLGLLSTDLAAGDHRVVNGVITQEDDPTEFLAGVEVTLFDAHGQKDPLTTLTGSDGKYTFRPGAGFYHIAVRKAGFFDNGTEIFRFDDTTNLRKDIQMERMPVADLTLTVHVDDESGADVPDARVEVFELAHQQVVATNTTNSTGDADFLLWAEDYEVRVTKDTFQMNVTTLTLTASTTHSVVLEAGVKLAGIATEPDGTFVEDGLVAFLYNVDAGTDTAKRLLRANVTGSSYTFHAYLGEFILIVDADGKAANITTVSVMGSARVDRTLDDSPEERVDTEIRYPDGDWNQLTLWRNLTLQRDSTIPGLDFAFIRYLRLQIHLVFGDGTGTFDPAELDAFQQYLVDAGPKHVDTAGFFTTNSRYYRSDVVNGVTDYTVGLEGFSSAGPVVDDDPVGIPALANYSRAEELDPIPANQTTYFVNLTASHDPANAVRVNTTYALHTPLRYERSLTTTEGSVGVTGWTRGDLAVTVDPLLRQTGDPEDVRVEMEVEKSLAGTARAVVVGPPNRFTELNTSQEDYTAVVPTNVSMTFSAEESSDPNSPDGTVNPDSNFTWTFRNESVPELTAWGIRPEVTFAEMGNYSGNLTIEEVGSNTTHRNFTVFVDGLLPVARMENNVTGLGTDANGTTIEIREGQSVRFFGGDSTDRVHPGLAGSIREWQWDFDGDGRTDATGRRVDWTFDRPGSFTVNLTVVDQAGHEGLNATMTVVVEDVTPPEVDFRILDEDFREVNSFTEQVTYVFDGTTTTDNFDRQENLTFAWDFGNGETRQGANVTFAYERYGTYTLVLNVTDRAGNQGNATRTLVIQVDPSQRPDLRLDAASLRVEPESPEESTFFGSVVVTVRVNVTNREGRAPAENVQVQFFAFRFGEPQGSPIPVDPTFLTPAGNVTNNTLQPGEQKTIQFTWTTGPLGNYTLRINVTDPQEADIDAGPLNSASRQVEVREAAWKRPLLIGSIVAIIVGIPVALYFRRRLLGRVRERITKR